MRLVPAAAATCPPARNTPQQQLRRTARCAAADWRCGGCCAAILLRAEDSIRSHPELLRALSAASLRLFLITNRYHRKGGQTARRSSTTGSTLCPKFVILIFKRRDPA